MADKRIVTVDYLNSEGLNKGYINNTFANALKGSKSGSAILIDDVSPITHEMDVKVRSKNLIPYPYYNFSLEQNGVTATLGNDGSITLNGTATEYVDLRIYDNTNGTKRDFVVKPGMEYTASGIPNGSATNTYYLRITTMNNRAHDFTVDNHTQQFNITEDVAVKWVFISVKPGVSVNNLVFKPQLELGSTATAYTPYVSDLTAVKVSRCGKNLLNQSTTELGTLKQGYAPTNTRDFEDNTWYAALSLRGYYDPNNNMPEYALNGDSITVKTGTTESKTLYGLSKALKCRPSTTYTLSYNMENGLTTNASGIGFYDADKKHISFAYCDSGSSFTTPSNCYWIIVCFHGNVENTYVTYSDIQLELGTTATDYEPYKECVEYTPTVDGTVEGVTSLYPNTTLMTDTDGVIIDCEYNRDINKAFAELHQAIISLGGNV